MRKINCPVPKAALGAVVNQVSCEWWACIEGAKYHLPDGTTLVTILHRARHRDSCISL